MILGFGTESLFVVPTPIDARGRPSIGDFPAPSVPLWWTGPWQDGVRESEPADTLELLRVALAPYRSSAGR